MPRTVRKAGAPCLMCRKPCPPNRLTCGDACYRAAMRQSGRDALQDGVVTPINVAVTSAELRRWARTATRELDAGRGYRQRLVARWGLQPQGVTKRLSRLAAMGVIDYPRRWTECARGHDPVERVGTRCRVCVRENVAKHRAKGASA